MLWHKNKNVHRSRIVISIGLIDFVTMSELLKIPESYKDIITVAIKGIGKLLWQPECYFLI